MNRRWLIKNVLGAGIGLHPMTKVFAAAPPLLKDGKSNESISALKKPITIYNNWSSYDELSDTVILTEALAMRELDELVRLKNLGVQFDYYVMDAFWFDKTGGYRTWRKQHWPAGPDRWIDGCKKNSVIPGLWFSVNNLIDSESGNFLDVIPEWKDSVDDERNSLCLFRGGYARHFLETLLIWVQKGIGAFKFDFADFGAATKDAKETYVVAEIEELNKRAFIDILKELRSRHPDVLLIGYNGFGGDMSNTYTPYRKTVESRWLDVFDTLYCGDPRFSDVPTMNIWRSMDIYSDHMVRQYEMNGLPLHRIDNCGFMVGTTGTCYSRGNHAWKGMQILEMARGGWVNVFHGNLELLEDKDAQWFARTQRLFLQLQQFGRPSTFGELPGTGKPYGFVHTAIHGTVCIIVNPSQAIIELTAPVPSFSRSATLYADGGFKPVLHGNKIKVGAEQLVVIGFDHYSDKTYSLGTDDTINIPTFIKPVTVGFKQTEHNHIEGEVEAGAGRSIRIFVQQFFNNHPFRTRTGSPPKGKKMDAVIQIKASQNGKYLPVQIYHDKMIWSGLSWGAGEIKESMIQTNLPIKIEGLSTVSEKLLLKADVYAISYK